MRAPLVPGGTVDEDVTLFRAAVRVLCRDLLPVTWQHVIDVRTEPLCGGITNELFVVTPIVWHTGDETQSTPSPSPPPTPPPLVLRIYGKGTDRFLDRTIERQALVELNDQGFGARCLGSFGNGRLEEFLMNTRTLTPEEMGERATMRRIASMTRKFHGAKVLSRLTKDSDEKTSFCAGGDLLLPAAKRPRAQTWHVLRRWHAMATTWDFNGFKTKRHDDDDTAVKQQQQQQQGTVSEIIMAGDAPADDTASTETAETAESKSKRREQLHLEPILADIDALEAECAELNSPVVLLHNDLLSGNFLVPKDHDDKKDMWWNGVEQKNTPRRMTLIDFEYSCYGPRGLDLANHFIEYAGFECDWSLLPDARQRRAFFLAYLKDGAGAQGEGNEDEDENKDEDEDEDEDGDEENARSGRLEATLMRLEREVEAFTPVSHLWWGLWAVMQATISTIDFDYLSYAAMRLAEYRKLRHRRNRSLTTSSHAAAVIVDARDDERSETSATPPSADTTTLHGGAGDDAEDGVLVEE